MKLHVLYAGDIVCNDSSQLNPALPIGEPIELANPIFLIQHPKGWVLWDTGLPDAFLHESEGVDAWIFHLRMKRTVIEQFEEIGIHPSDVQYLAFSHMHNDHTGNAQYFPSATLIMQEKEYDIAFHPDRKPANYNDYKALEHSSVIKLNGDCDVFGDGAIQFISTPGHTAGHQSLLLHLEETGYVLITGDISYYEEHYQQKGVPVFNTDPVQSIQSIEKVQRLVEQTQAKLWIQHDKALFDTLRKSPQYYQ